MVQNRNRKFWEANILECPICGGRATGKIGAEQYYCWDCCVEYRLNKNGFQIYELDEDGGLVSLGPSNESLF